MIQNDEHRFRIYLNGAVVSAPQRQSGDYAAADYLIVYAPNAQAALQYARANTEYQLLCSNARFNRTLRYIVLVLLGLVVTLVLLGCGGGDPEDVAADERVPAPGNPCYPDREVCK